MSVHRQNLPNQITTTRLVVSPGLVLVAWATDSRAAFLTLLGLLLLTDGVDGYLARKWQAQTDRGRQLDSWADYMMLVCGVAGIWLLWPEIVRHEWPWFAVAVVASFGVLGYGLLRWGRVPGYHTWLAKLLAVLLPVSMLPMLADWSAVPFRAAVALQVAGALEELAIALLLPNHVGEMKSAWHAWRQYRAQRK